MALNNSIDPGGPGPFNLILANQFKWAPTIIFKWLPNNKIDPGDPELLNLMFANQFKRITRVKLKIFILKVANSGPHVTFL